MTKFLNYSYRSIADISRINSKHWWRNCQLISSMCIEYATQRSLNMGFILIPVNAVSHAVLFEIVFLRPTCITQQ